MCHIQAFNFRCSHLAPELILCEDAKQEEKSRRSLNPTQSFKPRNSSTWCADCQRLIDDKMGTVVDTTGTVPNDSITWNAEKKCFLVPIGNVHFVSVTFI